MLSESAKPQGMATEDSIEKVKFKILINVYHSLLTYLMTIILIYYLIKNVPEYFVKTG